MHQLDLTKWEIPDLGKNHCASQIEAFILEKIKSRALQPGEQIPSYRTLARLNKVNRNTVLPVYTRLISLGWLNSSHGSKTSVSFQLPSSGLPENNSSIVESMPELIFMDAEGLKKLNPIHRQQSFISIGPQTLNESCSPREIMGRYIHNYRNSQRFTTQAQKISDVDGTALHAAVLKHMNLTRRFRIDSGYLELIRGRSESLKRIVGLLLSPGEQIVNTDSDDLLLNSIFRDSNITCLDLDPTATDFIPNLKFLLENNTIRALYIRPGCSYPKGRSLSEHNCALLIELAKAHHFYIIEEEDEHEFWYGIHPFKPLVNYSHNGYVIYSAALSRLTPYMQNLRTIVAPPQFINMLRTMPPSIHEYKDIAEEMAIIRMMNNGEFAEFMRTARRLKEKDLLNMLGIFKKHLNQFISYEPPENGLSIWIKFPNQVNLRTALRMLSRQGIDVPYYPVEQQLDNTIHNMRLDFSYYWENECLQAAIKLEKIFNRLSSKSPDGPIIF